MRWWRFLLVVLLVFTGLADARGRSGGGFGGSRSYRTPSYSRPYSQPRYSAPRGNTYNYHTYNYGRPGFGFPHFVFLPFFGFHPFGFGYGYGGGFGFGLLSVLFNIVLVIALIAFVLWLVRRMRRR